MLGKWVNNHLRGYEPAVQDFSRNTIPGVGGSLASGETVAMRSEHINSSVVHPPVALARPNGSATGI